MTSNSATATRRYYESRDEVICFEDENCICTIRCIPTSLLLSFPLARYPCLIHDHRCNNSHIIRYEARDFYEREDVFDE